MLAGSRGLVVEPQAQNPPVPEERKLVTVVFADVVGSTAWMAGQDPEFIRRSMARYFARMKSIAELHGGTVEKFIGDAVMVVFGVPQAHEDDAERAVRAAIAMREALTDLNHDLGIAIALRIGVNSGEVATGGAEEDRQFLVTGDAVNVVARLQAGAEPGEVVVGALTERLTRDAIEYEPRDPIIAKGKLEPVRAFRVLRALSAVPGSHSGASPLVTGLVGRTRELEQLLDCVDRAATQRSVHLVTLVGNPGVGKSRLIAEVGSRLEHRAGAARILRGRCLPYGAGITYWPLMDVVRADAGIDASDDRDAAHAKLRAHLAALLPSDRLFDVHARLAFLLGLEPASAVLPTVPTERIPVEVAIGFRLYLEAVAVHETIVVVIDDLQWADKAVIDVLEQIVDHSRSVPLLVVCVARPELLERSPSWMGERSNTSMIQLEPLDPTDTRTLLSRLLGVAELPPAMAALLAERSAGNPLFCEEFAQMLIESGYLEVSDGHWRATRSLGELPVPESVQSIVAARLDRLPAAEKVTLQRASVIGERFALDDLLSLDHAAADVSIALIRKGFFAVGSEDAAGRLLRFKHLVIRDVAYRSLAKAERARLHDRVGARLEGAMAGRRDEFGGLVAYHAAQSYLLSNELRLDRETLGPRAARALRWTALAGDRALALYATDHAARHYGLAIEIGLREHSDVELLQHLHLGRARALELRGAYDDAITVYEGLEALAKERGDERLRADALARQATIYRTGTTRFDAQRADELIGAALGIARSREDPRLIAELQRDLIHIHLFRGDVEGAIVAGEGSLATASAAGLPEQVMYTSTDLVCAYREQGEFERARRAATRATGLAREIDNKEIAANSLSTRAVVEMMEGNYDIAMRLWSEAKGIAESIDNFWGRSMSTGASALVDFERGNVGAAIANWEESLRLAEAVEFLTPTAIYRGDLGWCYRTVGAHERAERHLEIAHALVTARFPFWRAWILGHLSRSATARGDLSAASAHLREAEDALAAKTEWFAFQRAHVGLASVELKLALGDHAGAAADAHARADVQRGIMRMYVADLEYLEGEGHRLGGALDAAALALSRARATATTLGCRRILWSILASLARTEEARGDAASAGRTRAEARSIASDIADSLRPLGLAEGFLAQKEVRWLMAATGSVYRTKREER